MELAAAEYEATIPVLETLIELDFEDLSYHRALARIYNKLERTEEAQIELGIVQELLTGGSTTE